MAYKKYTVVRGDTLSKIAQRHGMTWRELYSFDGGTGTPNQDRLRSGDPDKIYPGETIFVPDSAPQPAPAKPGKKGAEKNVYAPSSFTPSPTVSSTRKIEVVEVVDDKGNTKEPDSNRRQYVNREDASGEEYGRRIRLKARYFEEAEGQTKPLTGEKIYWRAYPGPDNKTGLIGELQAGFDSPGSGTLEKETTTNADGCTPVVDFYVSRYGGDVFNIIAAGEKPPQNASPSSGEAAGTYEVWRELRYEVDCMTRPNGGTYDNRANTTGMKSNLAQAFVEAKQVGSDDSPSHQRVTKTNELAGFGSGLRQGDYWHREDLYFHLIFVDTIVSSSEGWREEEETERLSPGTNTLKFSASDYTLDPRDWFIDADYWQPHMGYTILGNRDYTDLDEENFTLIEGGSITSGTDHYLLTIDFPGWGIIGEGHEPSEEVHLRIEFKNWGSAVLSGVHMGGTPITALGIRYRERKYSSGGYLKTSTLGTMIHEPGHSMGLAATTLPDGSNCGTTYDSGSGHHCNNNSDTCVMYEANQRGRKASFCDNCNDALRGRDLSALPVEADESYT